MTRIQEEISGLKEDIILRKIQNPLSENDEFISESGLDGVSYKR